MAKIASLSVSIEADISKFEKGMIKSSSILSAFNMSASSIAGKGFDALIAGAVGASVALGALVSSSINSITQNTRLADRLQISTEAMGAFQLAARSVGVDSETANSALSHLSRKLGEAQAGGEEAQKAFQELGLDLVKISSESGAQQLRSVADAIKGIGSASGQSAALVSIFGKSGAELASVFSGGSEALDAYSQKADNLGLAINRIDSAKVEMAHQSFETLKSTFDGLITKLTVELSPDIAYLTNQFTAWATSSTGGVKSVGGAIDTLEDIIGSAVNSVHLFRAGFYVLQTGALTAFSLIMQGLGQVMKATEIAINQILRLADLPEIHTSDAVLAFSKSLAKDAKKASVDALHEWDDLGKGEGIVRMRKTFEDIRHDATMTAIQVAKGIEAKAVAGRKEASALAGQNQFAQEKKEHEKWVNEMQKKADSLSKTVSPFAKFSQEISEASELFQSDFIDSDIFGLAEKKFKDEFSKAIEPKTKSSFQATNLNFNSIEGLRNQDKKIQEIKSPQLTIINQMLTKIHDALGIRQEGVLI